MTTEYTLLIKPLNEITKKYYENHKHYNEGDSGLDLYIPNDVTFKLGETKLVDLGIQYEMIKTVTKKGEDVIVPKTGLFSTVEEIKQETKIVVSNVSTTLQPRSSIYKTPLMKRNHIGLIDAGYRGNIKTPLVFLPIDKYFKHQENDYAIRLFNLMIGAFLVYATMNYYYESVYQMIITHFGLIVYALLSELCLTQLFKPNKQTTYTIKAGTRLVQIVGPTLEPFKLKIVDELSETARGSGGFGSTGV